MLFCSWDGIRRGVRLELVHRIETVPCDAIDFGMTAPQAVIDGEIVPMVGLDAMPQDVPHIRMLRLSDGSSEVLYAVAKVEDAIPLTSELAPSRDDPLVEGMALVDGKPVSLVDGHTLFARHGAIPRPTSTLSCHLPAGDWAQAILAPLVRAAGYRLAKDAASADVAIVIDAQTAPADKAAIVRLRSLPDIHAGDEELAGSIYRYDRESVLKALRAASRGIAA